jgi:hypothetical protein
MGLSNTGKARSFFGHVIPQVIRPLRVLWNEIIGFVFIVLAASAVPSTIRNFRDLDRAEGGMFRIVLSILFTAVMAYFGVSSFLRARKISRS